MEKLVRNIEKNGHTIITLTALTVFMFTTGTAIAELPEPPEDAPWYVTTIKYILMQFPDVNGWFAAVMLMIMSILRGLADAFMFIAKKTETKKDDAIAHYLAKLMRWAGAVIGWFGLGTPKK
jgi:hypothetical protein